MCGMCVCRPTYLYLLLHVPWTVSYIPNGVSLGMFRSAFSQCFGRLFGCLSTCYEYLIKARSNTTGVGIKHGSMGETTLPTHTDGLSRLLSLFLYIPPSLSPSLSPFPPLSPSPHKGFVRWSCVVAIHFVCVSYHVRVTAFVVVLRTYHSC